MLPPRPFLDVIALRALVLWSFLRGVTWAGSAAAGVAYPASLVGGPILPVAVFVVVVVVIRIELGRRAERVFLANLGCSFARIATLVATECAVLEVVLRLGLG